MRLKYIFNGQNKEPHPFHVKSNWEPPIQPSVALETYLEEVKTQLAEVKIITLKNNLPFKERQAIKELKQNTNIHVKKADKGTTTVIMKTEDKKGRYHLMKTKTASRYHHPWYQKLPIE